jgi:DNA-binding CsgD family transcriptional regulator
MTTHAWPLTGRAGELANIAEAMLGGQYKGVLIAGDAGIGKTRLALEATATLAGHGWVTRRVAATASGRAVPLGAFARWLAPGELAGAAALAQVISALTADVGDQRLLLFVDDAHQLDELSALVLHQLAVSDIASVIATVVTGEPMAEAVTALWKDALLERLELEALSRAESERLLRSVLGAPLSASCADQLWDFTRGNVLFLRHLVDQERATGRLECRAGRWRWTPGPIVSPSLIELVEMHIGAVPEQIRDVVDLVAVAEPVDRDHLTQVVDRAALEAAEDRGLIHTSPGGDTIYVGHPLYGQVRRSHCGPMRLRRLRGQIAAAMARSDKPALMDPLRLGLLWLESDLAPDPEILTRAAVIARSRLDLEVAERLARAAVDANAGPLANLLLAYIFFMREKGPEAEQVLDEIGDQELLFTGFVNPVILRAANRLWVMQDPEASWDIIEEGLRRRGARDATDLHTFRTVQLSLAGRPAEALDAITGVDYTKLDSFGRTLGLCAETLALADLGRAKEAAEKAATGYAVISSAPQDSYQGTGTAEFHAYALLAAGYVEDAIAVAEQRYQLCVDLPGMISSVAAAVLGMTLLGGGDLAKALEYLKIAGTGISGYGDLSGIFYRFSAAQTEALARSGRLDAAMAALAATQHIRHPAYAVSESAYLLCTAWVAATRGRLSEARRLVASATAFAHSHGQWARELMCLQTAVQFGDPGVAGRLSELADLVEGPRATLCHRYATALADDDAAALERVSSDLEAMGDKLAAADAAAHAAISHGRHARRGSALTARVRAQRLARGCGGAVSPALAEAVTELPFTRREREVALLVGKGLSNREIADATSLSVRTVEGHVLRATAKAGVANRAELATVVNEFEDPDSGVAP